MKAMRLILRIILGAIAILLILPAAYYWKTPADTLLHVMPGFDPHSVRHYYGPALLLMLIILALITINSTILADKRSPPKMSNGPKV